jgi:hypothetical protein
VPLGTLYDLGIAFDFFILAPDFMLYLTAQSDDIMMLCVTHV